MTLSSTTEPGASTPSIDPDSVWVCPVCDLIHEPVHVEPGYGVVCRRCGHTLYAPKKDSIERTMAYALTGLLLFIPANFLPIMTLNILGIEGTGSIYDSVTAFWDQGYYFVAIIVGLTSLVFPFIKLSLLFVISFCLFIRRYPSDLPAFMRLCHHLDEWAMLEVYMLGILVAIIKLHHMAHIHYDIGFMCFIALMVVTLSSSVALDEHLYWERIEKRPR